ncbi:MAG: N-6 DNA methylase [Flavobacteriaceae bacterium]
MLDNTTRKRIDDCRDILVGKLPDPKSQIEQITIALIYKFMDDMDKESIELGGAAKFFSGDYAKYSWDSLFDAKVTATEMLKLYSQAIESMEKNPSIPPLFRDIFKNAYLPYRDPETLKLFLKTIGEFEYTHSEKLGDAFEYLLSVMGSQGDAGQFRTPRHIIDFLVKAVDPNKTDTILDPACGTAGFLISAFKRIKEKNNNQLTPDEHKKLIKNFIGYDISPDMVRLSLVNLYLHGFSDPHIFEYDTLTSEARWNDTFDVVLANPPFMSPKGGIRPHKKFTVTSNRSEVLFVDYIAEHLNPNGRAGIIVPEGVIFQSGKAYKALRKVLVENYLYAVVSLPAGVFNPYSGVKTSVLFLDKALAKKTNKILFVKIDNDGYNLGAQRNAIKGGQLDETIDILNSFKENIINRTDFESTDIAHSVEKSKIAKNGDFNLSGERYKISQNLSLIKHEIVSIGDVFKTSSGGTPLKKHDEYYHNGTIPWLRSGEVAQGYIKSANIYITEEALKNSSAKIFPNNTVLVAMYGATAGQVGILKFEASTNQAICGIYPNDKVIPEYLYLVLKSQKDYLISLSGGGAQPNISQKIIRDLKIPLPPLSVQKEIVAEIEGYQKIIDGAQLVVKNYKPQIDPDSYRDDPDWEMVELGEIAKPEYGYTEKAKNVGNTRFIRITDIDSYGKLIKNEAKYIDLSNESKKSIVKKNDILVARTGATYGKTMIFEEDYLAVFASFLIRLNFNLNKVFPKYYWVFAQSKDYIKQAASLMTGGGQPQFNGNVIKKIKIPIPPLETQKQIVAQIEKEQELVNSSKQLIEIFEKKIKNRIAKVWGEEKKEAEQTISIAAEPQIEYKKG